VTANAAASRVILEPGRSCYCSGTLLLGEDPAPVRHQVIEIGKLCHEFNQGIALRQRDQDHWHRLAVGLIVCGSRCGS